MTKQEAAIISTYTGILIGEFSDMHEYIEKIMNRPVFTHELGDHKIVKEIKQKSKQDFINILIKEK
ncbi:MAG: hypothetical protein A2Y62_21200 [Candidatus Fischerbacteria bacterium RBG_13_37_8]|uniref:DUF7736 domain-containing protein n=1 Tax=Candidatus Fischerbacteria bacterium RBG_13_37_8 TaxID=1817863 RepID=A0A1F5V4Z7_9BACT|nr:MAG: hypothetical protein A2Y62_21200 [Candidatus Fischerbacteria bacterium RBG_13_37_8]